MRLLLPDSPHILSGVTVLHRRDKAVAMASQSKLITMEHDLSKTISFSLALLILLIVAAGAIEQSQIRPAQAAAQSADSIAVSFKEYKLANGLRIILSEDPHAPTYSICVTYNVGSRDEKPGRTPPRLRSPIST